MSDERVPSHPVDALLWFAKRDGIELNREWIDAIREYCDEEISVQRAMRHGETIVHCLCGAMLIGDVDHECEHVNRKKPPRTPRHREGK